MVRIAGDTLAVNASRGSRCMTRFWCAYCSAPHTPRTSSIRARTGRCCSAYRAVAALHHEVRQVVLGAAAVEQAHDVRMLERGADQQQARGSCFPDPLACANVVAS
jgi:hypothetical protein